MTVDRDEFNDTGAAMEHMKTTGNQLTTEQPNDPADEQTIPPVRAQVDPQSPPAKAAPVAELTIDARLSGLINEAMNNQSNNESTVETPQGEFDLSEALTSDDPVVRSMAQQLSMQNQQLGELSSYVKSQQQRDGLEFLDKEATEFRSMYEPYVKSILGASFSDKKMDVVITNTIAYMNKDPDAARVLTFEEAALRVHPQLRAYAPAQADPNPVANPTGSGVQRRAARLVTESASTVGTAPAKYEPGPGERFDDIGAFILKNVLRVPE